MATRPTAESHQVSGRGLTNFSSHNSYGGWFPIFLLIAFLAAFAERHRPAMAVAVVLQESYFIAWHLWMDQSAIAALDANLRALLFLRRQYGCRHRSLALSHRSTVSPVAEGFSLNAID